MNLSKFYKGQKYKPQPEQILEIQRLLDIYTDAIEEKKLKLTKMAKYQSSTRDISSLN